MKRWCNKNRFQDFAWQAGFYEHVIRTEAALNDIREYIVGNPGKWAEDRENPAVWQRVGGDPSARKA